MSDSILFPSTREPALAVADDAGFIATAVAAMDSDKKAQAPGKAKSKEKYGEWPEHEAVKAAQVASAKPRKRKLTRRGLPKSSLPPVDVSKHHMVLFQVPGPSFGHWVLI